MKIYKKSELKLVNGMLVHEETGDVVSIDNEIVDLANELETRVQKAKFIESQPSFCPGPDLSKFKRESVDKINMIGCMTPLHDKKVKDAIAFMNELDDIQMTDSMNEAAKGLSPLIIFAREDFVLSIDGQSSLHRFDTPVLGDPLKWDEDVVFDAIAIYHGIAPLERDEDEADE